MSRSAGSATETYNPLKDKYLRNYFNNHRIREHLHRTGVITRDGRILSEQEQKKLQVERKHRRKVQNILTKEIDFVTQCYQRQYQLELQKRLDSVQKLESRLKVKGQHLQPYDDYNEDLLEFNAAQMTDERATADLELDTLTLQAHKAYLLRQIEEIKNARQVTRSRSVPPRRPPVAYYATPLVPAEHPPSYSAQPQVYEPQYEAPPPPIRQQSSRPSEGRRSRHTARSRQGSTAQSHYSIRSQSSNPYKGSFRVDAKCECYVLFLGKSPAKLKFVQQHCGGNGVTLFSGEVKPQEEVKFLSWRHVGYPFALTVHIDSTALHRINVCCESRIAQRKSLDGAKGSLVWLGVRNAVPCYKCHIRHDIPTPFTNYDPDQGFLVPKLEGALAITDATQAETEPDAHKEENDADHSSTSESESETSSEDEKDRKIATSKNNSSRSSKKSSSRKSPNKSPIASAKPEQKDESSSEEMTGSASSEDHIPPKKEETDSDSSELEVPPEVPEDDSDADDKVETDKKENLTERSAKLDEKQSERMPSKAEGGVAANQAVDSSDSTRTVVRGEATAFVQAQVHQEPGGNQDQAGTMTRLNGRSPSPTLSPSDSDEEEKDMIKRLRMATNQILAEDNVKK